MKFIIEPYLAKNRSSSTICLLVFFSLFYYVSFSQDANKEMFSLQIENILKERPFDYQEIESRFKSFRRDSVLMKSFIRKSESAKYIPGKIYALNALGVIYRNVSFYQKSISLHKQAEDLSVKIDNIVFQIISLNNVGVAYRRMDLVKPALDYHTKALDLARSVSNKNDEINYNIAVSLNSIGNIYLVLEQYDLAIKQFEKSLEIEKKQGNRLGLAINYQNIGFAQREMDNFEKALKNFRLSLEYNNQINSNLGRVICYNSIGEVYIKQNKLSDAKSIIEKALEKALIIGDQFYIATSYINLGWVLEEMGKTKAAEHYLKKGQAVARTYSLNLSIVESGKHLSELYNKTNRHNLAYKEYKEAIELEKTINNDRNLRYVNDVIIQYENEAKNRQITAMENKLEKFNLKFERNKTIFWYSILGLFVITSSFVALYRNRRLKQEKQILTLEQDMLRSQMNPHFIFNSLNSIKLYIINNEKQNAVYYLNKFSKLIRKILVATSEKETSLEDELETMQLYMNIENIRFSNEIDFKIIVEDNVNIGNVKVPSLILQPFLENALWHGLSSKKKDKKISLKVCSASEDYINISIEDNGIGRVEAQKIKDKKLIKRKSVGVAITKARLINFSKSYTNDFSIKIEDLYDASKNPIGTRVLVTVPTVKNSILKTA